MSEGEIQPHQWQIYLYQSVPTPRKKPWLNYMTCFPYAITHLQQKSFLQWRKLIWYLRTEAEKEHFCKVYLHFTVHYWRKIILKELLVVGFCFCQIKVCTIQIPMFNTAQWKQHCILVLFPQIIHFLDKQSFKVHGFCPILPLFYYSNTQSIFLIYHCCSSSNVAKLTFFKIDMHY